MAPVTAFITALDLVTDALRELRIVGAADVATADDSAFALTKLNRIFDRWNNQRCAVYCDTAFTFTTAGLLVQPVTMGPSGDFEVAQRPQTIEYINYVVNKISTPLRQRNRAWWAAQPTPVQTGTVPTDFYYLPNWPDGEIYLWPVCAPVDLEIITRVVLSGLDLTSLFSLPPGYQDALTLTLAEELAPAYGVEIAPILARNAQHGRARIFAANAMTTHIGTRDAGLGHGAGTWDYQTGRTIC